MAAMDYFEERRRRQQRLNSKATIWPPSPSPSRSPSPPPKHRSKKRHTTDAGSDSERRKRKRKDRERKHKRKQSRSPRPTADAQEDWVEKPAGPSMQAAAATKPSSQDDSSGDEIGPKPAVVHEDRIDRKAYGEALLPGEGSAMAAFVASGERIPRRGEIGLDSNQIEAFEKAGYVMSGSRNQRMNAVRIRKENQVISAEEKRAFLKAQKEEKEKRESQIIASFRELVNEKLHPPK